MTFVVVGSFDYDGTGYFVALRPNQLIRDAPKISPCFFCQRAHDVDPLRRGCVALCAHPGVCWIGCGRIRGRAELDVGSPKGELDWMCAPECSDGRTRGCVGLDVGAPVCVLDWMWTPEGVMDWMWGAPGDALDWIVLGGVWTRRGRIGLDVDVDIDVLDWM